MVKKMVQALFRNLGYEVRRIPKKVTSPPVTNDFIRLRNEFRKYEVLKLHFGCGPRVLKGWINIDLVYEPPYENYLKSYGDRYYPLEVRGGRSDLYAFDMTKQGLPLPDNSVDVIFHEDFLEHLSQRDQIVFMAETFRTLKKGGTHRVNTPDILYSMREHSHFARGRVGVYVDEWDRWHHLNVLTPEALKEMALLVGHSSVIFSGRDQSVVRDRLPFEYRPGSDRPETGNIFADLIK